MPIKLTSVKNSSKNGTVYHHSSGQVELSQGKNAYSSSKITNDDHDDDDDLKSLIRNNNNTKQQQRCYDDTIPSISKTNYYCNSIQGLIQYQLHNCCYFYPITCTIISILIVSVSMWLVIGTILNPYEQFGIQDGHDHSNIQSKYDLHIQEIDHFCLGGHRRHHRSNTITNTSTTGSNYDNTDDVSSTSCTCENPLEPYARVEYTSWILAFKTNLLKIEQQYLTQQKNPDVAFVGSSIVEEMEGRWMGITGRTVGLKKLSTIYQQNFGSSMVSSSSTSTINGITLGIAGDTSPNVLWRLMNGEMPTNFNPKVWWLVLGMNDLARTKCSEEVTLLGILRIVEEILEHKPDTHIVINSLLPMTALRGDDYPVFSDVQDSFSGGDTVVIDQALSVSSNGNNKHRRRRHLATLDPDDESNLEEMKKLKDLEIQAETEEKQRDKKHKKKNNKTTRNKKNILMKDKKKIKKFKPGHIRQNTLPLWTSIQAINSALQKFVSKHSDRVSYFDADSLFVVRDTNNTKKQGTIKTRLRTDRTTSKGHPTISGFVAYEEKINTYLQKLLVDIHFNKKKNSNDVIANLGTDDQFLNDYNTISSSNEDDEEYDDEYLKEDDDGWKSILNSVRDDTNDSDSDDEGNNESADTEVIQQPSTGGDDDLFGYDELLRPDENDFNNDDKRYANTDDY